MLFFKYVTITYERPYMNYFPERLKESVRCPDFSTLQAVCHSALEEFRIFSSLIDTSAEEGARQKAYV